MDGRRRFYFPRSSYRDAKPLTRPRINSQPARNSGQKAESCYSPANCPFHGPQPHAQEAPPPRTSPDSRHARREQYQSAGYCERSARLEWLFCDAIRKHQTGGRVTVFAIAANGYRYVRIQPDGVTVYSGLQTKLFPNDRRMGMKSTAHCYGLVRFSKAAASRTRGRDISVGRQWKNRDRGKRIAGESILSTKRVISLRSSLECSLQKISSGNCKTNSSKNLTFQTC